MFRSESVKMKLFTAGSENFVGILQYRNDAFVILDSPFTVFREFSHTYLNEHFPLDHLAKTSNIASIFVKLNLKLFKIYIGTQVRGYARWLCAF